MDSSKDEIVALVDRFMMLGASWCLDNDQVASLLGAEISPEVMFDEGDLVWALRRGGHEAERRMRLLVEVDGMIGRLVPDGREIPVWLRTPSVGYIDELATPLQAMSSGAAAIRALRDYLDGISDCGRQRA